MSEVKYKICSKCGAQMQIEEGIMTSSIPPMYRYHCPQCGALEFDTEKYPVGTMEIVNDLAPKPIDIHKELFDWYAFRAEAAKDAMCAIMKMHGPTRIDKEFHCKEAVAWADELIKLLRDDNS